MKIGELVRKYTNLIFAHCDTINSQELDLLLDKSYSKRTFGVNYSFCCEVHKIPSSFPQRYWRQEHLVRGRRVRVTGEWYANSEPLFRKYLFEKRITSELTASTYDGSIAPVVRSQPTQSPSSQGMTPSSSRANSRFSGDAIGNAQNRFIRNILSNLGTEAFNEADWNTTKEYFSHKCVYCGSETELLIEHAIPINRLKLGEHRLGNLVPSCKLCNSNKGGKDYKEFLGGDAAAISKIETYMNSRDYIPLEDNPQMKMILNMAHEEVAALADRYITLINEIFPQVSSGEIDEKYLVLDFLKGSVILALKLVKQ